MVTYSPERDTVSKMFVDAVKESDTLYRVKAKVMVEGQGISGRRKQTKRGVVLRTAYGLYRWKEESTPTSSFAARSEGQWRTRPLHG